MFSIRWRRVRRVDWLRWVTATVALVMQVTPMFGSLAELRDQRAAAAESQRVVAAHGRTIVIPGRPSSTKPHDETTCPACIARSMHARLETLAPLPVLTVEERTASEFFASAPRQTAVATLHLSRAPPVTS